MFYTLIPKKVFLISILLILAVNGFSQSKRIKMNSVFVEWPGVSGAVSLNYERLMYFDNHYGITLSVGFSPWSFQYDYRLNFPIQSSLFYEINNHTIKAGLAVVPYLWFDYYMDSAGNDNRKSVLEVAIATQVGYHYSLLKERFYLGLVFSPFIFYNQYDGKRHEAYYDFGFLPWATLRLGCRF